MADVQTLSSFDPAAFRQLARGYVSGDRYTVTKVETRERTVFTLELEPLVEAYTKHFDPDAGDLEHYSEVVEQGFSLGAFDGPRLVGIAIAERWRWNNCLWIWEFHVAEGMRGQGIGRKMAEELRLRAQEAGFSMIAGETQNTNVPGITAYRKLGAEIAGLDLAHYGDVPNALGEIAVFMKYRL